MTDTPLVRNTREQFIERITHEANEYWDRNELFAKDGDPNKYWEVITSVVYNDNVTNPLLEDFGRHLTEEFGDDDNYDGCMEDHMHFSSDVHAQIHTIIDRCGVIANTMTSATDATDNDPDHKLSEEYADLSFDLLQIMTAEYASD